MSLVTMSIQEGLNEINLLNSRIEKSTRNISDLTAIVIGERNPSGFKSKEEFENNAKSSLDSVMALIDRRTKIKNAIIQANATIEVEVDGVKMFLAEAINMKTYIQAKRQLLNTISSNYNQNVRRFDQLEQDYQEKLNNHLQVVFSAKGNETKDLAKNNQAVVDAYAKNNKPTLLDPVGVSEKIKVLIEEIEGFENKIDFVLTRANITNDISFEDQTA